MGKITPVIASTCLTEGSHLLDFQKNKRDKFNQSLNARLTSNNIMLVDAQRERKSHQQFFSKDHYKKHGKIT